MYLCAQPSAVRDWDLCVWTGGILAAGLRMLQRSPNPVCDWPFAQAQYTTQLCVIATCTCSGNHTTLFDCQFAHAHVLLTTRPCVIELMATYHNHPAQPI